MTKIISDGFPEGEEVLIDEVQVKYLQGPDNCSGEEDYQELTLLTKDGGAGKYINLKTNEHGWSISNESDLKPIFEHFKKIYEYTINT